MPPLTSKIAFPPYQVFWNCGRRVLNRKSLLKEKSKQREEDGRILGPLPRIPGRGEVHVWWW